MSVNIKGVSSLKKIFVGFMLLLMVCFLLPAAAGANEIGYVNFELLFYAHPEYDLKNKELQDAAEKLQAEIEKEAAELEASEVEKLGAQYEIQFQMLEQEVRNFLIGFILEIIEEVAEEARVSVVLWESSVVYGGADLTSQVIEAMYKAYGISVPSDIRELM